jgi:membrane protease YdiL (CAAX protease family)
MRVALAYIAAIVLAELVGAYGSTGVGASLHGVLIVALLIHFSWGESAAYRRLLPVLALAPLLRLLSLAMPAPQIPSIYWYALVGIPLLLAAGLTIRLLRLPREALGLQTHYPELQTLIAVSGLPLGLAAFTILRPQPLFGGLDWAAMLVSAVLVAFFTGFTEEFIFRGLVQAVVCEGFGAAGAIVGSSVLFAAMYIGSLSPGYVGFMAVVGLYFGFCVDKTRSLWGVAWAHSLMSIGLIVIWPALLASPG